MPHKISKSEPPPEVMTWSKAAPALVVALIFDAIRFMFEWFIIFGPALAAAYCTVKAGGSAVAGTLCTTIAGIAGVFGAEVIGPFGVIMAMATGFAGWLVILLIFLMFNGRIFKENALWFGASLLLSEIPIIGSLPALSATVWKMYRTQIRVEKAAYAKWEKENAARLRQEQERQAFEQSQVLQQRQAEQQKEFENEWQDQAMPREVDQVADEQEQAEQQEAGSEYGGMALQQRDGREIGGEGEQGEEAFQGYEGVERGGIEETPDIPTQESAVLPTYSSHVTRAGGGIPQEHTFGLAVERYHHPRYQGPETSKNQAVPLPALHLSPSLSPSISREPSISSPQSIGAPRTPSEPIADIQPSPPPPLSAGAPNYTGLSQRGFAQSDSSQLSRGVPNYTGLSQRGLAESQVDDSRRDFLKKAGALIGSSVLGSPVPSAAQMSKEQAKQTYAQGMEALRQEALFGNNERVAMFAMKTDGTSHWLNIPENEVASSPNTVSFPYVDELIHDKNILSVDVIHTHPLSPDIYDSALISEVRKGVAEPRANPPSLEDVLLLTMGRNKYYNQRSHALGVVAVDPAGIWRAEIGNDPKNLLFIKKASNETEAVMNKLYKQPDALIFLKEMEQTGTRTDYFIELQRLSARLSPETNQLVRDGLEIGLDLYKNKAFANFMNTAGYAPVGGHKVLNDPKKLEEIKAVYKDIGIDLSFTPHPRIVHP